jgi:hypothetical protein
MRPKELHRTLERDEVSRHRYHDCERYDSCLVLAAREGWSSFSCMGCSCFVMFQESPKFVSSGGKQDATQ